MSDAIPLPLKPEIERLDRLANDLVQSNVRSDSDWAKQRLREFLVQVSTKLGPTKATSESSSGKIIDNLVVQIEGRWRQKLAEPTLISVDQARSFVAREHGFVDWDTLANHVRDLNDSVSPVFRFESAVDAIVSGDQDSLAKVLDRSPALVHERSTREHRSTLLHYVSANGVEDFRQKTPPNIVDIARLLLDLGADVNAVSEAYGGRSTTLGLAAASCHPEDAGVQLDLLDLLLSRGARMDGPDEASVVLACLYNGRGEAAAFLAKRGAKLDLEGAAGVGRLDLVQGFFDSNGRPFESISMEQAECAFAWACQFGHAVVAEFLLDHGVRMTAPLKHHGQTGLHWAAFGGHADVVRRLLARGADVNVKDQSFDGAPLGWAIYGWGVRSERYVRRHSFSDVVSFLTDAGASLDVDWFERDGDRAKALRRAKADPTWPL